MKIKYPKTRKSLKTLVNSYGLYWGMLIVIIIAFLGGMLFYRAGYAERITSFLRGTWRPETPKMLTETANEVTAELENELQLYQANGLATVFLDIPFDAMLQIETKRDEALAIGVLYASDDDFVSATMRYNDEQTLNIKLRLKGDWVDHLAGDKWSFRVHVTENDGAVLGMRRFSLQGPQTRTFMSDWGFHQTLFREGILATRYHFVNVIINGEHKGVYALEESFSEDLLESQERREGIILRFNEDLLWYDWGNFINTNTDLGRFWLVDNPANSEITPFRGTRVDGNETLSEEFQAAEALLSSLQQGLLSADQALDEDLWGRYFAITDLWGGGHGTAWHNDRFYFNPVTSLLEPVAFDAYVFHPSFSRDQLAFPFYASRLFESPGVQKAYVETLERILAPGYLEALRAEIGPELEGYYKLLLDEYADDPNLQLPWETLETRRDLLARNLNPEQPIRGYYHLVEQNGETFLQLDLINLMVLPVQIHELVLGDEILTIEAGWCLLDTCTSKVIVTPEAEILLESSNTNYAVPASFSIPASRLTTGIPAEGEILTLQTNLYGGSRSYAIPIYPNQLPGSVIAGVKPTSTLDEALAAHEFLTLLGDGQLATIPGDWHVNGDLIIPKGYTLFIPENTSLRFGEGNIFFVSGTLEMAGSEDAPILLTAQNENWGGMVVLNASGTSQLRYVQIEKTAGIPTPGWVLTGGVTFYESAVEISHSVIGDNATEDALNVIRAPFEFSYVEFRNTPSDAFDGDFTTGTATNCSFHDIQGDAFDVSGSHVSISDSYFANIADKAISAGEGSAITLDNLVIRNVNIGIASKDLSLVRVSNSLIDAAHVAGLAAYIKKPQYGPAIIEANELELLNTALPAICQTDSEIILNGESIRPENIDVDAMYTQGILGK